MNIKNCGGKVPVFVGGESPYKLVDFPSKEVFNECFKRSKPEDQDKYWTMLHMRLEGNSLSQVASKYSLTRERIRQIEAKFLRRLAISLNSAKP
jgi:hypothetical protein